MVMTVPDGFSLGSGWDKLGKELTLERPCTMCGVTGPLSSHPDPATVCPDV